MGKKIAVYALTPEGAGLARKIAGSLEGDLFLPERMAGEGERGFGSLGTLVAGTFREYAGHVFVAAAGIVVRVIAGLLEAKDRDPAVVVLDQAGKYAVSLLSGHLGGANELAGRVAGICGARPVITTATDTAGLPSLDMLARDRGLKIGNPGAVKKANAALLEGRVVRVEDPEWRLGVLDAEHFERMESGGDVRVTWKAGGEGENVLLLHPPCLWAGVGCRKGTGAEEIVGLLKRVFGEYGLAVESLAGLASVEDKREEPGLIAAARALGVPLRIFTRAELARVAVPHPSAVVKKHLGLESVCEAAAMLAARGRLLAPKARTARATLACALEA